MGETQNNKPPANGGPKVTDKDIITNPSTSLQAEALISKAIEQKVPVETMERLLAMRRELKAEWAEEQYYKSLAAFQSECPVVKKTKIVRDKQGEVRYQYAPIEAILQQVGPFLKKHGFSYTVDAETTDNSVTAITKAIHSAGHTTTSHFRIPIDPGSFMNAPQKFASALTFAKRYAFLNAFGILTADEDNDSNSLPPQDAKIARPAPAVARPATQTPAQPPKPISKAQIGYIKGLQKSKGLPESTDEELAVLNSNQASTKIEDLRHMAANPQEVPSGY